MRNMALSKDIILDAAERVAVRDGIAGLTLDAVAQQAGASKGGLMHHFRSKDALLEGMVSRIVDNWRDEYTRAIESAPLAARGVIDMAFGDARSYTESCRRSSVVLIAALVNNPKLIAPVRRAYQELFERLGRGGRGSGVDEIVMLAVHGLWFEWMFGLRELTPQRTALVHDLLARLLSAQTPVRTAERSTGGRKTAKRASRGVNRARKVRA